MSEPKPIQNKPLLIGIIVVAVIAAGAVVSLKKAMGHDEAKALATTLMQQVCARDCASRGLREQDLQGPSETDMNKLQQSTKFEFVWQAASGQSLRIRVWDNGLTVQKGERWNDMNDWVRL